MGVVYAVTPELREKFKEPFGLLLRGTFSETMKQLSSVVKKEKPSRIVSVGDRVSRNLHEHGISPQLSITDNKSLRRRVQPATFQAKKVFYVKNPQGTITEEAVAAVQEALRGEEDVHVIVDGEEDLLTLIAVLYAPENAFVLYGQPYEGVVVVKVTAEKKAETEKFLEAMACSKS
jgi:GTP-dependent dephospho-CoA kinase